METILKYKTKDDSKTIEPWRQVLLNLLKTMK